MPPSPLNIHYPPPKPATLLSLPSETRLQIYPLLFPPLPITLTSPNPIQIPPILQTTSLPRTEALPIFFSTIELRIHVSLRPTPLERAHILLAKIPETQLREIRRFVVEWGECFEVTVQLIVNPKKRVEDGEGVVMGEKWYVLVRSMRESISEDIGTELAKTVSKWIGALLEGHNDKDLFLDTKDLCWLIASINRHGPGMLQEVCGL